jgi:hypothetical protein
MPTAEPRSARTFCCAHCQVEVRVCPQCDRGQRYCGQPCREQARRRQLLDSGRRYQGTAQGRCAHARRQQRYREREKLKEVTHQSSQEEDAGDVLAPESSVTPVSAIKVVPPWHCQWCGRTLPRVVRHGFLRHAVLQDHWALLFGAITRGRSPP